MAGKTLLDLRAIVSGDTTPVIQTREPEEKKEVITESVEPKVTPKEEIPERTNVVTILEQVKEREDSATVSFEDGNSLVVESDEARVLHDTYLSLNRKNREEMGKMLNESLGSFSKAIFFSYKNAREA